jgi:PAS domain S-box-containing protein
MHSGVIQEFNRRAAELWGRVPACGDTYERFCGSFGLYRPDGTFMPHEQCPMADVLSGKVTATHDAEVIIERPDHSQVTVVVNIRPLKNERGEVTGAINCFYDITERKQAEDALRLARKRYSALVTTLTSIVWTTDAEGHFIEPQPQWQEYTGQRWDEHRDFGWANALHPDDRERVKAIWLQALESRSLYRASGRLWHAPTQEHRYFEAQAVPLLPEDGSVREWIGCVTDVHDRRKAEMALAHAQEQLADRAGQLEEAVSERTGELTATNKQLEAFVYSIAHDLRAPLRSMQGFSAILVEEESAGLSKRGCDFANRINRSAQFMDALLQDLLAFSRIAQQRIELASVNLESGVQSVLSRLEKEIQDKNARITNVGPWPTVLAREPTLGQVLFNLISNALKFARPDTPPLIRLRAEEQDRFVRVWVEDNGIGIAPDYQEQIFRLFIRLHGQKYPGTGIGLAIVQKSVERMGGRVGVESTPGEGTRFWFELRKVEQKTDGVT